MLEIDHGWVHSIYTEDPDRIAVEFAVITEPLTPDDAREALELLFDPAPPIGTDDPRVSFHQAAAASPT